MKRALSLSTRTLIISFICMCAVLSAGFLVLHAAVKSRIKEALKENLERTEYQLDQTRAEYHRRDTKLLAILSNDAGLKAAIGLLREQDSPLLRPQVENTIEDQLREISTGLDYDLLMVMDTHGRVVATAGASFDKTQTPSLRVMRPGVPTLLQMGQTLYDVTGVPINLGVENLGTLVVGKKFDLPVPGGFGYSVVIGPRGIVASTLPGDFKDGVGRQLINRCGSSTGGCEIGTGKGNFLVLGMSHAGVGPRYRLLYLASISSAMSGFTRGLWQTFLITGLGGVLMALILAAFVSRSISKPLADLAAHLEKSGESGDLPGDFHVESSTLEVNMLARALSRASRARRQYEIELMSARDAAEGASRAKSEFLANVSHELRTPMNGILGLTDLMLDTELTPHQREDLEMVKTSGETLLAVITNILDFSKIEDGKIDLAFSEFSLRAWLDEILGAHVQKAREKGLKLAGEVQFGVRDAVVGDPVRLRQITMNLVGNAIKFTEQGQVTVRAEAEQNDCLLHLVVEDTGIGIAADKQKIIFEAFSQADGSATRKYGGTGLGLAISSRLVKMMQGRIWVESEVGRGSRFHFTARLGPLHHLTCEESAPETTLTSLDTLGGQNLVI